MDEATFSVIRKHALRGALSVERDFQDAEDAAQEAALEIWSKGLESHKLAEIVGRRRAIDAMRKRLGRERPSGSGRRPTARTTDDGEVHGELRDESFERVDEEDAGRCLLQKLARLYSTRAGGRTRRAWLMALAETGFEGTLRQIAEKIGVSESRSCQIKKLIARDLAQLMAA